jgi:hypothetical protein
MSRSRLPTNLVLIFHVCYMSSSFLPGFDHPTNIKGKVDVLLPLYWVQMLGCSSTLYLNILNICYILRTMDQFHTVVKLTNNVINNY